MSSAPDGGYGWLIMMSAFGLQVIYGAFGPAYSVLKVELAEMFGVSRSAVGWPGSILAGMAFTGKRDFDHLCTYSVTCIDTPESARGATRIAVHCEKAWRTVTGAAVSMHMRDEVFRSC